MTSHTAAMIGGPGRARGLSNTTNLPTYVRSKTKDGDMLSQLNSASAHKQDFSPTEPAPKREPSKALLNDDWRNKWRPDGAKFVRFPVELNSKTRVPEVVSKADKKKLRIDTVTANLNPNDKASYVRYPRTSVDPDFILSAPATKREYDFAGEEEDQDLEFDDETGVGMSATDALQISFGSKQVVHLTSFTPTTEHGFRQMGLPRLLEVSCRSSQTHPIFNQPENPSIAPSDKSGPSSVIPISSGDIISSRFTNVQFPDAEIRQIKNAKKNQLKPMADWKEADEFIQNSFAKLEVSRAAVIPINKERENFNKIRQKDSQDAATIGVLEDPSIKSIQLNDQTHIGSPPRGTRSEAQEKSKFNALLAKLNNIPASRTNINDPAIISIKPASCITIPGKVTGGTERRLSNDSAISGTGVPLPQKAISQKSSTLNPTASEFSCSFEQNQQIHQPLTFDIGSRSKSNRPSVTGPFKEPVHDNPATSGYDFNYALLERLANLEVQIDQLSELHALQAQKNAITQQLNISSGFSGLVAQQSSIPPGFNGTYVQGPMLPPDDTRHLEDRGPVPSMGSAPSMANSMHGLPASVLSAAPLSGALLARLPPSGLFHNISSAVPDALPSGLPFSGIHMPSPLTSAPGIPPVKMHNSSTGPLPMSLAPTPVYFPNSTLGPKPVRKPKGPARPGDPLWAKSQQEYEAYLEWRRANDPEYHQQCKERQSKRADRVKNGLREKAANSTARSNAAIEIKAPESAAFTNRPSSGVEIKPPKEA